MKIDVSSIRAGPRVCIRGLDLKLSVRRKSVTFGNVGWTWLRDTVAYPRVIETLPSSILAFLRVEARDCSGQETLAAWNLAPGLHAQDSWSVQNVSVSPTVAHRGVCWDLGPTGRPVSAIEMTDLVCSITLSQIIEVAFLSRVDIQATNSQPVTTGQNWYLFYASHLLRRGVWESAACLLSSNLVRVGFVEMQLRLTLQTWTYG